MSDQYKLYKLRSGEEIIAKIVSKTSKKVILFRPMQVKIQSLIDREGGMMRDIVLLRRWLDNTFEINCELPLDYVAVELKPTPDIVSRYLFELEKEDAYYDAMRDMENVGEDMDSEEPIQNTSSEFLDKLMTELDSMKEMNESLEDAMDEVEDEEENHILMNFLLPPEMFLSIMNTINDSAETGSDEFNMSDLQGFLKRLRDYRENISNDVSEKGNTINDKEIEERFSNWDPEED